MPAIAIATGEWLLSDTPNLAIAHGWLDLVLRKLAHMAVFGALAATAWLGLRAQGFGSRAAIAGGAGIALAYACVDELHQTRVPTRHGSLVDVAIDGVGIVLAAMVLRMLERRRTSA